MPTIIISNGGESSQSAVSRLLAPSLTSRRRQPHHPCPEVSPCCGHCSPSPHVAFEWQQIFAAAIAGAPDLSQLVQPLRVYIAQEKRREGEGDSYIQSAIKATTTRAPLAKEDTFNNSTASTTCASLVKEDTFNNSATSKTTREKDLKHMKVRIEIVRTAIYENWR